MWGIVVVTAIGAIISAVEVPALVKKNSWGVLAAFFATLLIGLSLLICLFIGVKVPSPLEPLRMIYEPIGKAIRGE